MFIDIFLWLGFPAALIAAYYLLKEASKEDAISFREGWEKWKEAWWR